LIGIGVTFIQGIWYDYEVMPVVIFHVVIWLAVAVLLQKTIGTTDRLSVELFFIATVFTILCASFFYGRYQAHYATAYPVAQTIVLADGNAISTDANVVYLGKTSGFYFYYKSADREALV